MKNIIENTNKINEKIVAHRRQFHANPELSYKEFETCKYICKVLDELKIPNKIVCKTGVVATVGNIYSEEKSRSETAKSSFASNNQPIGCIAFRADIDALPISEETNLSYSSKNAGIMHACGHDFHAAMLLGAAEILKENEQNLNGIVKFIFQYAEESLPGGAKFMIENGVLENPTPEIIFAQHCEPDLEVGKFATVNETIMAATCEIYWTIKGKGTHAAQPHQGSDPITVAANIITFAQTFINRYRNPLDTAVLSICSVNGGTANNISPDEVKLSGTLRTFNEKTRNELLELLEKKCKQIANSYDTVCEVEIIYGYPPVKNSSEAVDIVRNSVVELFGQEYFSICEPKMIAEDFAYFAKEIPACFYFVGVKNANSDLNFPLHNAKFNPNEKALAKGTALIVAIAEKQLKIKN